MLPPHVTFPSFSGSLSHFFNGYLLAKKDVYKGVYKACV